MLIMLLLIFSTGSVALAEITLDTIKNKFKEVRLYCYKPYHGKTIHTIIKSQQAINAYTTINTNGNIIYMKKHQDYRLLADDTSSIGIQSGITVGKENLADYGLYNHGYYITSIGHFQIYEPDRMQCDDTMYLEKYAGTWQVFIR